MGNHIENYSFLFADLDWGDRVLQNAVLVGLGGSLVAEDCPLVALFSGDLEVLRGLLGDTSHKLADVGVGKVVGKKVNGNRVAITGTSSELF